MKDDFTLNSYGSYLFVFAHPDDETNCCVLMRRLVQAGKKVSAIYATSGDRGGLKVKRTKELRQALRLVGVPPKNILLLDIPENELLVSIRQIIVKGCSFARTHEIDCVITLDYEGGHNGHDAVCFAAQQIVVSSKIRNFYVFPDYHGVPSRRKGARFKSSRRNFITLPFNKAEKKFKQLVVACHQSQKPFFDKLQAASSDYYTLLYSREVFFRIRRQIDFRMKPTPVVGYAFNGKFTFEEFQRNINNSLLNKKILCPVSKSEGIGITRTKTTK